MTTLYSSEKESALLTFLEFAFAEQYQGLDDEMPDSCNEWIGSLTDDELLEIVIGVFRNGI